MLPRFRLASRSFSEGCPPKSDGAKRRRTKEGDAPAIPAGKPEFQRGLRAEVPRSGTKAGVMSWRHQVAVLGGYSRNQGLSDEPLIIGITECSGLQVGSTAYAAT